LTTYLKRLCIKGNIILKHKNEQLSVCKNCNYLKVSVSKYLDLIYSINYSMGYYVNVCLMFSSARYQYVRYVVSVINYKMRTVIEMWCCCDSIDLSV